MTRAIRRATSDEADLATIARIVNETSPEDPPWVDELRWADATYPGGVRAGNARLGYRPTPELLRMRGPLFDGMMGR